ncbi:MAG: pyridoxamine 5'-phosphate oxidase family protein [Oscillospiraceae bacterium]|nr:pyridoxamine 5'-phosphate oxidase family protein [Oscillospiraceae bacterium]
MINQTKIAAFIRKQKIAFICSVDEAGYPNVKAMLKPRKTDGLHHFYFSTNTSSMRVKQYRGNPNACIYFCRKGLFRYTGVMLKGKMEVLTDQKTKDLIWRRGDTLFYRGGVTDPDYCVLKFTAESGRYYCNLKTESFDIIAHEGEAGRPA